MRACPSGALSYGIDDVEARSLDRLLSRFPKMGRIELRAVSDLSTNLEKMCPEPRVLRVSISACADVGILKTNHSAAGCIGM